MFDVCVLYIHCKLHNLHKVVNAKSNMLQAINRLCWYNLIKILAQIV